MSLNTFTARAMTQAVRDLGSAQKTGYLRRLFVPQRPRLVKTVDYGVKRSNPHIGKARREHEGALPARNLTGQLKTVVTPRYRHSKSMDAVDAAILDPAVASYMYGGTDPNANLRERLLDDLTEMRSWIDNSHIVNCATSITTGSATFTFEGGQTETIDFEFGSAGTDVDSIILTTLAGDFVWGGVSADIRGNLRQMVRNIRKTSNYPGKIDLVMGTLAYEQFIADSSIQTMLDNRRMFMGSIVEDEMVEYRGTWNGHDIYEIDYAYETAAGVWTDAWNPKVVAALPSASSFFTTEYGAIYESLTPGASPVWIPTDYFSKVIVTDDPPTSEVIVEGRPLPLVKNPLAMRVRQVLA